MSELPLHRTLLEAILLLLLVTERYRMHSVGFSGSPVNLYFSFLRFGPRSRTRELAKVKQACKRRALCSCPTTVPLLAAVLKYSWENFRTQLSNIVDKYMWKRFIFYLYFSERDWSIYVNFIWWKIWIIHLCMLEVDRLVKSF